VKARTADSIGLSAAGEQRVAQVQAVYDLAAAVARAMPPDDLYREAVTAVCTALEIERAALLVADEAGVMRFRAWQGLSEDYRAAAEGHSPWAPGDERPLPVVIEDPGDESLGELRATVEQEGIRGLAFVPLVAGGRLLGELVLCDDRPRPFGEVELRLALTIAASVAVAIEWRRLDGELRSSRDQLQAIFQHVADGITVLDRDDRFVFANDAAALMCGFESVPEMLATPTAAIMDSFRLYDADGRELTPEQLPGRRVLAGEPAAELLVRYRSRSLDGERWSKIRATPITDDQGVVRFAVSIFQDVTEERRAELEQDRLRAAEHDARADAERAVGVLARLGATAEIVLGAASLDDLLGGLLDVVRDALGSDRATILLLDGTGELVHRAAAGIDEEIARAVRIPLGEGVAGRIAATQTPLIVDDLSTVDAVSQYLRSGSLAGVPLLFAGRLLGILHVSSDATGAFDAEDLGFLKIAAERVVIGIEQTRLFEREHEIATALQRSLLPERFPRVPGLAISAVYLPAADGARVGGDWYEAFPVGDGRVLIAVGDVVGHGIGAAASMGQIRHALRAYACEDPSPARVFARLNAFLIDVAPREFCTAFCAIVDPWAGTVEFVNAGHPAPLALAQSGEARFVDGARSVPLGVLADVEYESATGSLGPGSTLLLYTDGLVERRDETLDERLELLLREVAGAGAVSLRRLPETIAAALLADGPQTDDAALLAVRLASSDELRLRLPAEPASLAVVRRALAGFLARAGASAEEIFDVQVACGEACANIVEHAYGRQPGLMRLHGSATEGTVIVSIRDTGRWKDQARARDSGRGNGLRLMRAFADEVEVRGQEPSGTEVVIVRELGTR